jgi:hypothetical protein
VIFILSPERSGSTLLRVLLDAHPQVAAPGELGLGDLCHRLLIILTRTLGQTEDFRGSGPAAPLSTEGWLSGVAVEGEAAEKVLTETRELVEDLMGRYARACGKERWCNKTPSDLAYAEMLRLIFPEARFLCLHRQGLDVAASCLEISRYGFMRELAPSVMASPTNTVAAMLRNWVEKTEQILLFEERWSGQCLRLRYEDLVARPQETLSAVLSWLGLRPCPDLHRSAWEQPHHRGGGDPRIWTTRAVEGDRLGAGRSLPRSHIPRALAEQTSALLERLGYPPAL